MVAAAKTYVNELNWTVVAAGVQGGETTIDFSTSLVSGLSITVCPIEAVAHALGTLVQVFGHSNGAAEDDYLLYEIRLGAGTANAEVVGSEAASGQGTILVASTTEFETLGDRYLIHNTVSAGDSEIVRNAGFNNDVSITTWSNLVNTQQSASSVLYNIVAEKYFPIPNDVSYVRVMFLNDDADCDVLVRVIASRITGVA